MPRSLLLVDDDPAVRRSLSRALGDEGLKVLPAANAEEGIALFEEHSPDLVLLDLFLPDQHGLEVLKKMREKDASAAIIVITASDDIRDAVEAMKMGAMEYLQKPYDLEALLVMVRHALDQRTDRLELGAYRKEQTARYTFEALASANERFAKMTSLAKKLAQNATVSVLLEGETGVGKEFMARAMHLIGPRARGPFVPISCAAIPQDLLESELFGHEAGAFTDARGRKKGLFELAESGTLFLDEIGEMPVGMQAKLLRAIETMGFRRVGGTEDLKVDARVMAATNVGMEKALAEKRFRQDLYYRLKVGRLLIPPLREHVEDVIPLAERLLQDILREVSRRGITLSEEARRAFVSYRWPGNVRELKNVLERAVILCEGDGPLGMDHLPQELGSSPGSVVLPPEQGAAAATRLDDVEREHILRVVKAVGGNHTRAAKALGISRTTLWEKLKQYRISGGNE